MKNRNIWSIAQDQILQENWGIISASLIAGRLGAGFSKSAITGRARRLGLRQLPRIDHNRITRQDARETKWTKEHDQIIADNWGKSSSALIADMIGGICTRNAVIGRAHRIGLPKLQRVDTEREVRPRPPGQRHGTVRQPRLPPPPPIIDAQIPFDQRKTLMDLGPQDCRWPVGEPQSSDFYFCGGPKIGESSYCAAHHHRAHNYAPEPSDRRSFTTMTKVFGAAARPVDQWLQGAA